MDLSSFYLDIIGYFLSFFFIHRQVCSFNNYKKRQLFYCFTASNKIGKNPALKTNRSLPYLIKFQSDVYDLLLIYAVVSP